MKNNLGFSLFFFLILSISGTGPLQAQRKININDPAKTINKTKSATSGPRLPSEFLDGVEEYREFYLNPQLKSEASTIQAGDEIEFEFSEAYRYTGTVISVAEHIPGITGITAKLQGYDFAYGYMAVSDKGVGLTAIIPETNQLHAVNKWGNNFYLLKYSPEYIERQASLKCGTPGMYPDETPQDGIKRETVGSELRIRPGRTKSPDPIYSFDDPAREATIRLMYVYTSAAMEHLESLGRDRDHDITLSMLESQLVLDNSQAGVRLELARVHEIECETMAVQAILQNTVFKLDSRMNEIHTIRDAEDIDIVVLATRQTALATVGGVAYPLESPGGDRNKNGFVAIGSNQTTGSYVIIHEIGHTIGCNHHIEQTCEPALSNRLYTYATAWKGVIDNYHYITVMGYPTANCHGGIFHRRLPYFSSPDITLNGVAIGNEEFSNNALVWRQVKHVTATYGKGIRIDLGKKTASYGSSGNIQATVSRQNFNLRSGDRIVYTREPGDVVGIYATDAHIEDSNGLDVTDDLYYLGNLYIASGTYEITPRELTNTVRGVERVYDGTTNVELDISYILNPAQVLPGDDLGVDASGLSANFADPNVDPIPANRYLKDFNFSGVLTLTGGKASCYTLRYPPTGAGRTYLRPAPLSIGAKKVEIPYGTDPSTVDLSNAYIITGLVNNETASVLSGSLLVSIDPAVTSSSPAGVYPDAIKISGYTATNYAITYKSADLEIKSPALASQTITFNPVPNQNLANGTYQLSATASSGLPVSYTSGNMAVATVDANGLVTFHAVGQTTITAAQNGNAAYVAATPVSRELVIYSGSSNSYTDIVIYPNPVPAQKKVSVSLTGYNGSPGEVKIELYDLGGNAVETEMQHTSGTFTFGAPSAPGMYIIHVIATGLTLNSGTAVLYVR